MSNSPRFIDGVYNYCDRWCERCPLTARCRLFETEREFREEAARSDEENASFWDAFDQLAGESPEYPDDALLPDFDPLEDARLADREERTDRDPLVALSYDYAMAVHVWLKGHEADFPDEADRFTAQRDAVTPAEALEVIAWHHFQINVKVRRAVDGLLDAEEEAEENAITAHADDDPFGAWEEDEEPDEDDVDLEEIHRHDSDGSAKVALIGIERSFGAWTLLRHAFPREDGQIQDFQRRLARLRRQLDARFPNARTFRRPGFDE